MTSKRKDIVKEIATRDTAANQMGMLQYLPNPDPILKRLNQDISAYREVNSDSFVAGCVRRRKAAVKSLKRRINYTDNSRVSEAVEAMIDKLKVNTIITEILNATLYGYQPLEIMSAYEGGLIVPTSLVAKPPEWFLFGKDNELRFKSKKEPQNGEKLREDKFIVATQDASYDNPYGRGDLGLCFWPSVFKKGGLKYWFEFVDKYGSPSLYAKLPRNTSPKEEDEALESLERLRGNSASVFPTDAEIHLLESIAKGASSDVYKEFMNYCRSEIAIAILGQNQTTEANSTNASATAGLEVADVIRDDDATIVTDVFNTLIKLFVEHNFGAEEPPEFELYEQEALDTVQAERDTQLNTQGVRFSKAYYLKAYGLEEEDITEVADITAVNSSPFGFSEPARDQPDPHNTIDTKVNHAEAQHLALESATDQLLMAIQDESPVDPWLEPILDCLTQNQPQEASKKLAELYPNLPIDKLTEKIARIIFVAEVWGRISVQSEAKRS